MPAALKEGFQQKSSERIIFLADMNSYFATCEQMSNPALRGKPIGVGGSNLSRTVVTAASYEAKRYGVKNGMSVGEAKQLCPELRMVTGDPDKYFDTTKKFLKIFQDYTPDIEPFSIDEAFLDLTGTQHLLGSFIHIAKEIKKRIREEIGSLFTCSIGISYNKRMAKLASSKMKPDGLVWIKREVSKEDLIWFAEELGTTKGKLISTSEALKSSKLTDLCGIGSRTEENLLNMGISTIEGLARTPVERLKKRFGVYGIFLYNLSHGEDPSPVIPYWLDNSYKSMGHHYTLPEDIHDREKLEPILLKLSEKIGRKLRAYGYKAKTVHLFLRKNDFTSLSQQHTLPFYTNDGYVIYQEVCRILDTWIFPEAVRMVGIQCSNFRRNHDQLSLLESEAQKERLIQALDKINNRFGEFTVMRGKIMDANLKIHVGGYLEDKSSLTLDLL
jgi:DNA polymerase-4